jgi:Luciferase
MPRNLDNFEQSITSWPDVSVHVHRFGGREFRFGDAEIGHIHRGGILDIPFPRPIRDALLAAGLADPHHWVPDSGWVTFRIRTEEDWQKGLWLMRISYLRYSLKTTTDPETVLERESVRLDLSAEFKSLLARFIPAKSRLRETHAA